MRGPPDEPIVVALIILFIVWLSDRRLVAKGFRWIVNPTGPTTQSRVAFKYPDDRGLLLFWGWGCLSLNKIHRFLNFGELAHLYIPLFIDLIQVKPPVFFECSDPVLALLDSGGQINYSLFNIF